MRDLRSASPMTRCDYDTIFQRVFCVTLVAIAFTFTVILTNVFIDIDGLLSRKDKVKSINNLEALDNAKRVRMSPNAIAPEPFKTEKNYEEEIDESYRNKRSLESQNFLFHIKNPKMKSILTSRLATLLEELDDEESPSHEKEKADTKNSIENDKKKENAEEDAIVFKDVAVKENEGFKQVKKKRIHVKDKNKEDMLHLAMHNILLQGIIGHMDLDDVYKKIHQLVNNFKVPEAVKKDKEKDLRKHMPVTVPLELSSNDVINKANLIEKVKPEIKMETKPLAVNEETKFFEEMAECDKLQNEIAEKGHEIAKEPTKKTFKIPNVLIKTIIDITARNKNESNGSKENVKGIIQLIYNGQPIKFSRMEEDSKAEQKFNEKTMEQTTEIAGTYKTERSPLESEISDVIDNLHDKFQEKKASDSYISKLISEYIKQHPKALSNTISDSENGPKYNAKRYKRQIKISYDDNDLAEKIKPKRKPLLKPDDDELYVEIETHFDSKGLKGEKKKKLIRNLIQKIQKAIHSDIDIITEERKKKHKHTHYKKRTQHPLDKNRTVFINKVMIPFEAIIQRHSDPISKSVPENQPMPMIVDKSGESWRKEYFGPGFLAVSKSLNSAELGEVEVDYNKVVALHGIPQRVQKPLNTEVSEESLNANTYNNLGNLKFFVKNLDGAGLSIGFNQYMDEPPDPETMKVFTGVENILHNYQNSVEERERNNLEHKVPFDSLERGNDIATRDISRNNEHVVIRRSVKELNNKDYHSNEYKIIFDSNYTPYDSYDEIIRDKNKKVSLSISKNNLYNINGLGVRKNIDFDALPALLGDNIFYQKLKPSEILSLASMLNRKKRAVSVKKISKLRNKMKLSKFINTKKKKMILNKKRSKRQIDKIRIIATDALGKTRQSAENIFLVSNENLLSDRAVLREVEPPEGVRGAYPLSLSDMKPENNYHNVIPYTYDEAPVASVSQYQNSVRPSSLMSRYPHVFMEDMSRSGEDYDPVMINKIEIKPVPHTRKRMDEKTTEATTPIDLTLPKVEEILGALSPNPKQNYKLTVKIVPKNISDLNSGFKEIHTSINKSFNKNGLVYSSLVNVSEISKVEKIYNPLDDITTTTMKPIILSTRSCFAKKLGEQQSKMDILLKQHKKKIDEQLEHLRKERLNLETLTQKNLKPNSNLGIEFSTKTTLLPQIGKFDIGQLVASALLHLQGDSELTTATTAPTTQTTVAPSTEPIDPVKTRMLSTIEKNEVLTNEILQQINKNTDILQKFLSKLSDKLLTPPVKPVDEVKAIYDDPNKFWRPYAVPFMPTAEFAKNISNERIPLVYAFQQPYTNKQSYPLGNLMYPGHVDPIVHRDPWQYKPKEATVNATKGKYFMDGLDNGYKTILSKKKDDIKIPTLQVISRVSNTTLP